MTCAVKHRQIRSVIAAASVIGVMFVTMPAASGQTLDNGGCIVLDVVPDTSVTSINGLRDRLASRLACQDALVSLVAANIQALADVQDVQLDSVTLALAASSFLQDHILAFRGVVTSPEADLNTLSTSLKKALVFVDAQGCTLATVGDEASLISDLSQEQQVKLQATIDETEKFLQTLSNVLKKVANTSEAIIRSLK